jgi:hypothetical protein
MRRSDVTTFTIRNGITKGLFYKLRVQAINDVGDSLLSDELVVPATIAPSAPRALNVTGSSAGVVQLSWQAPLESGGAILTGYYFYYQTSSALAASPNVFLKTVRIDASLSTYSLGSLTVDTEYTVKMVAENARSGNYYESDYSESVRQYTGAVPASLATLSVVSGSRTSDSLAVSWGAPGASTTDVLGYRVYANEPDSGSIPTNLVYNGEDVSTILQVRVSGLQQGRVYWFSYRVLNRAGWSASSFPYLKTVAGPLPTSP